MLVSLNKIKTPLPPIKDSVARLVNAIASTKKGREYLAAYDNIVPLLFFGEDLLGTRYDKPRTQIANTTAENLLAAAFKISLITKQRIAMLHKDVPQWLINHMTTMEHSNLLTDYQLKSVTALLLVLTSYKSNLRHKICECLTLLESYLSHSNPDVLRNIRNTLTVLMVNSTIRAQARGMGLASAIEQRQTVSGFNDIIYLWPIMLECSKRTSKYALNDSQESVCIDILNIEDKDEI